MAGYRKGVETFERPTPLLTPVPVDSAFPVCVGAAPIHKLENPLAVLNVPQLIFDFAHGQKSVGYSDNWRDAEGNTTFGLSEFLFAMTRVHRTVPICLIPTWNPMTGAVDVAETSLPIVNGVATIENPMAMISTVKVLGTDGDYERDKDYSLAYNDDENLSITVIPDGSIPADKTSLSVTYKQADISTSTEAQIIGGVDSENRKTGIEAIDYVFPMFQRRPAFVTATGYNQIPGVGSALKSQANKWTCIALLDIPCGGEMSNFTKVPQWKNLNSYVDPFVFAEWGCTAIGDRVYWGSTRQAGLHGQWDARNGGLPYESTSNKLLSMTALCQPDGTPIPMLSQDQANFLGSVGVGTFINVGGWRAWGIQTSKFPSSTDIKDAERSVRRMFCFARAVIELTMFQEVAKPISPRLRDRIMLTSRELMNLWKARGALIAGHVEFTREDNPNIALMSGEKTFQIHLTPPNATRAIIFAFQYNPDGLERLFE